MKLKLLAISGSMRATSSNSFLLESIARIAEKDTEITLVKDLDKLPIFNPDLEGCKTPPKVEAFAAAVSSSHGLLISSPEYVRSIPGGLKNAIDWLVSREELINKPIALAHASNRGDDMLDSLRVVLSTVSENFSTECFVRIPLVPPHTVERMRNTIAIPENTRRIQEFMDTYVQFVKSINE